MGFLSQEPGVVEFGKNEQQVKEIMAPNVLTVEPTTSLREVAAIMKGCNSGSVPVL